MQNLSLRVIMHILHKSVLSYSTVVLYITQAWAKITNFSLYLFVYFFSNNYNIGELTSAT